MDTVGALLLRFMMSVPTGVGTFSDNLQKALHIVLLNCGAAIGNQLCSHAADP